MSLLFLKPFHHPIILFLLYSTVEGVPIDGTQDSECQTSSCLNKAFHGKLQLATPLALPCFSRFGTTNTTPNPSQCAEIQENYTSPLYRVDRFSAYFNTQSEICDTLSTQQCLLDPSDPSLLSAISGQICNQGAIPPYYIEVQSAADVKSAFSFASLTHMPLVIKNTGHDFNGRSSGPGALALWTRKLQDMQFHASFVPAGCKHQEGIRAITTGAGVIMDQVYEFADQHNSTIVGGSGPTVGLSGGWVMTGGHGVLTPTYGLGIDRVLQFQIVTPDGVERTVNGCQNPDLFWALRGGGGGTFGVVLSATHRVEGVVPLSVAFVSLPPSSLAATQQGFLDLLVSSALDLANQGWGGPQTPLEAILATPLLDLPSAKSSLSPILAYVNSNNGSVVLESHPTWYSFYAKYLKPGAQPAGFSTFSNNRLIPKDMLTSPPGRAKISAYIKWLFSVGLEPFLLSTTPYLYSGNGNNTNVTPYAYGAVNSTSATPAWRNSAFMLVTEAVWAYNSTRAEKQQVINLLKQVSEKATKLAPDAGTYANEAQPWTQNWEQAFWGSNYDKLLSLKRKWDPQRLLACYHCIDGRDTDVVGGKCLGSMGR